MLNLSCLRSEATSYKLSAKIRTKLKKSKSTGAFFCFLFLTSKKRKSPSAKHDIFNSNNREKIQPQPNPTGQNKPQRYPKRPYPKFCVNTHFNLTVVAQAITEFNHKPIHSLFPVLNRHCPFLRRIFNRKPYHLEYRIIGWKDVPFFNHSANHTIERFHGICGVNRFANVRRIIKKCGNIRPVISQHLATSGYFSCHFCESAVKASKACASVEA